MSTPAPALRAALTAGCLVLALTGCSGADPTAPAAPTDAPASPSARLSATATPAADLTRPGVARRVVGRLLQLSGQQQAVLVDITTRRASVTVLGPSGASTWTWDQGRYFEDVTDVKDISQARFLPADYAIDDVGALFEQAAALAGSDDNQRLQIVEYNDGRALITVSTDPESHTVFFRPDGSPITHLDLGSVDGLTQGLNDVASGEVRVLAVGIDDSGLWADAPGSQPGQVVRRTRQADLPTWSAAREEDVGATFSPDLIRPQVLSRLIAEVLADDPTSDLGAAGVGWTVRIQPDGSLGVPLISIDAGDGERLFTLAGVDITEQLG